MINPQRSLPAYRARFVYYVTQWRYRQDHAALENVLLRIGFRQPLLPEERLLRKRTARSILFPRWNLGLQCGRRIFLESMSNTAW